jgi:16S rRNA (cytosine967-C5)-methyltransferase
MAGEARAAAARAIGAVLDGKSLNQCLPPQLERTPERDRALVQQLCYGTLRQAPLLQALLDQLLQKPLRERDRDVQGLLLCGLYQLVGTRVPDHAAVSETVAATARLNKAWARGMTNAVLRRYLRERDALHTHLAPAARLAHPGWLLEALQAQWPGQWQQIVDANNQRPPMTLRVNLLRGSRDDYLARLSDAGIGARPGTLSPAAIYLDTPMDVTALPGFGDGDVSVQDEAAQLAAPLLGVLPGHRVLDACAAPGGKTGHLLELAPDMQSMTAMDIDATRLSRVADNLQRLGLHAELCTGDGARPPAAIANSRFDRILLDAPCSASGVIRRHPDVKLLRRPADIAGFSRQQRDILAGLWPRLAPGGRLLYVTCSVLEDENRMTVEAFIKATPDACAVALPEEYGEAAGSGRQLLPDTDGGDGLFYALLERKPEN